MSDTVLLAMITGCVTICCAIISHMDRHQLAGRAQLRDELVASELAKPNAL